MLSEMILPLLVLGLILFLNSNTKAPKDIKFEDIDKQINK